MKILSALIIFAFSFCFVNVAKAQNSCPVGVPPTAWFCQNNQSGASANSTDLILSYRPSNGVNGQAPMAVQQLVNALFNGLTVSPLATVSSNAALKALSVGTYSSVYRAGFLTAGDGGAAYYNYSSSACSLNSGAGDNGSQVAPTTGGGCWLASFSGCAAIDSYGGNGNGTADNTAAWAAVVAAQRYSTRVCVQFGAGTYYFASAVSVTAATLGSVTLQGAGADATVIEFASGQNGVTITYADWSSSATVQNLTIAAMGSNVGSTIGLNLTTTVGFVANQNAQSNILNVTVRGSDGYARTNVWHTGVQIFGVRWVNVTNLMVMGGGSAGGCTGCINNGSIGLNYAGTSTAVPVQLNIQGSHFDYVTYGINYGTYAQGLVVNMCDVVGGVFGIYTSAANVGNDQLTVSNSNFNVGDQNGVTSGISGAGIFDGKGVTNTQIVGNTFLIEPNAYGYSALSSQMLAISGNTFQQINNNNAQLGGGVVLTANTLPVSISGNVFDYLPNPIWMKSGTNNIEIAPDNSFYGSQNGQNILDQGTNNVTQLACGGGISNQPNCLTDTGTHTYGINQMGATISKFSLVSPFVLALGNSTSDPRVMLGGNQGGVDGNGALILGSFTTSGLAPYVDFHSKAGTYADFRIQSNNAANTGMFYVGSSGGYVQVAKFTATADEFDGAPYFPNVPTGTPASYACFDGSGHLISSAGAC